MATLDMIRAVSYPSHYGVRGRRRANEPRLELKEASLRPHAAARGTTISTLFSFVGLDLQCRSGFILFVFPFLFICFGVDVFLG